MQTKEKRTNKYDEKLAITGRFEDVIKVSMAGYAAAKLQPAKPPTKTNSSALGFIL